jgi:myo-inositol 2-dehydrogenase / D-chiro-inositol 1-dehydrogenase
MGAATRIGLLGCGVHAHSALLPALTIAGGAVCAVYDPDDARATSPSIPAGCRRAATPADLLAGGLDAVIVAAPPNVAGELVRLAVTEGLPVFVEKPVDTDADRLDELCRYAHERGDVVQVGFMRRFSPVYRQARRLARRARQPIAAHLHLTVEAPAGEVDYLLKDAAIHQLDLCRFLLGEISDVQGCVQRSEGGVRVLAVLDGQHGVASVTLSGAGSWGYPSERAWIESGDTVLEVTGVGRLVLHRRGRQTVADDDGRELAQQGSLVWEANPANPRMLNNSLYLQGYVQELQQFLRAAAMKAPMSPGLPDALAAVRLADQLAALPPWKERSG